VEILNRVIMEGIAPAKDEALETLEEVWKRCGVPERSIRKNSVEILKRTTPEAVALTVHMVNLIGRHP
jgi:hypothetical protein